MSFGLLWLVLSGVLWGVFALSGARGLLVVDGLALIVLAWVVCRRAAP